MEVSYLSISGKTESFMFNIIAHNVIEEPFAVGIFLYSSNIINYNRKMLCKRRDKPNI